MKKLFYDKVFYLMLLIVCAGTALVGCSDDDDDDDGKGQTTNATMEAISGKYNVKDSGEYDFIELTADGNYVIAKIGWQQNNNEENRANTPAYLAKTLHSKALKSTRSDKTLVFTGTYTIAKNNTLMLQGYGTLVIVYNGNTISSFKLTPTNSTAVLFKVEKGEEVASGQFTDNLFRKWKIISNHEIEYENGLPIRDEIYNPQEVIKEGDATHVLISKAGTYVVYYHDGSSDIAKWRWKDISKGIIQYTWDGEWYEEDFAVIELIHKDRMKVTEQNANYFSENILIPTE